MRKKMVSMLLATAMVMTTLAGCGSAGNGTSASSATDSSATGELDTSKEVNLVMYVVSDRPAGQDAVDENLNKLLKEKLNCTLTVNWIAWSDYANKYPLLFSSGEQFDMAYTSSWLNFTSLAQKGAWTTEMNYIVTNHPIMNAVLNQKYKQAKVEGILLVLTVSDMEELSLDDEDIVTLLTNLLDNAIEATRLVEKEKKIIKCRLTYQNNTFSVVIRNPVLEQVLIKDNRIKTTKADKENHGMGIVNISNVVNKYSGNYIFSCTNGYFTSTVIMNQV